jgi:hypothetical protein
VAAVALASLVAGAAVVAAVVVTVEDAVDPLGGGVPVAAVVAAPEVAPAAGDPYWPAEYRE